RAAQREWLDDYALFRALYDRELGAPWTDWRQPLKTRDRGALEQARAELARGILYFEYLPWIAGVPGRPARHAARDNGISLFGDLPFMVDANSADVWARQHEFHMDISVGVPPDAFSATGQDWGMPLYRWDVMAGGGFAWLRSRARRSAALFD